MESIVISSENLITNRKVRDMIGYGNLADSCKETLTIIKEGLKQLDNPKNDSLKVSIGTNKQVKLRYYQLS